MHRSLERVWSTGSAALGGWVSGGGEFTLDVYRRTGYDYVGIDCQHSLLDEATVAAILWRTPPDAVATIVRVSRNDPALLGKLADAGADGLIVPMIDSADDARAAVAALRFPPEGTRSLGPIRADLQRIPLKELSARVAIFAMIETAMALDNVADICAVPGLAGVYVGPADLSVGLGLDPSSAFSTDQLAAPVDRIAEACRTHGLVFGMHQTDPVNARRWISRGARLVTLGADTGVFKQAATERLAAARKTDE